MRAQELVAELDGRVCEDVEARGLPLPRAFMDVEREAVGTPLCAQLVFIIFALAELDGKQLAVAVNFRRQARQGDDEIGRASCRERV